MRYAVYYAPPAGSLLHELGSRWLGRDCRSGLELGQPAISDLELLTMEPRRYGFHATLKAPFELAEGVAYEQFRQAVSAVAARRASFMLPELQLVLLDHFLALVPSAACPALDQLAADCVTRLEGLRAPLSEADFRRRLLLGLTPRQEGYLRDYGYPFVLDDFRFHMTLSGRLDATDATALMQEAQQFFAPVLMRRTNLDSISIFVEPRSGASFRCIEDLKLGSSVMEIVA